MLILVLKGLHLVQVKCVHCGVFDKSTKFTPGFPLLHVLKSEASRVFFTFKKATGKQPGKW